MDQDTETTQKSFSTFKENTRGSLKHNLINKVAIAMFSFRDPSCNFLSVERNEVA